MAENYPKWLTAGVSVALLAVVSYFCGSTIRTVESQGQSLNEVNAQLKVNARRWQEFDEWRADDKQFKDEIRARMSAGKGL